MFLRISSGNKENSKLRDDTYKRSEQRVIRITPFVEFKKNML